MANADKKKNYLDAKTLDQIKRLDVRARVVVEGFITGQHRSPYHGFAVEFASHREYAPGDDLRHIDWKVWSKTDRLYIKEYEEETNLKCHLLVDCSKSMRYGEATGWSKYDYAATAAASLGYMMQQQQDAVGLVLFSNRVETTLKASTNPSHMKKLFHTLETTEPDEVTDISDPFLQLSSRIRQRGMVILFSDLFLHPDELAKSLMQFRYRNHEVVVFHVMHTDELEFPFEDNTLFRGLEMAAQLNTEPRALRKAYLESVEKYMARVKRVCATAGIDHVLLDTGKPLDGVLSTYLNFRAKSRRKL
ncbi:MAG: DUF58 domain-containing protein [Planctomycetota bacterium]